ncbi:hypothetical protein [Sorangium sp. So ce1182]|uniref:hypothetical protein n=1 Tax=Sorangium sp. So ce1182 TaxID=3133334 RepID=UPI003F5ED49C
MPAQYDALADIDSLANDLPYRSHVERYTYWELLGAVEGKSVLDVACGDGMYWSRATYEQALEEAGFKRSRWTMPACSPEGEAK